MRVDFMMLAPYAELSEDGKVSMISGDFDTFNIRGIFPGVMATPCYVIIKLVFSPEECGHAYLAQMKVQSPDGNVVVETEHKPISPTLPNPDRTQSSVRLVFAFGGMFVPMAGEYKIQLLIDGTERKSIPLF